MSQITTHVLDTTKGIPAKGIAITLEGLTNGDWIELANGITNDDGRIADLLEPDKLLEPGTYRMIFQTGKYFSDLGVSGFYPSVTIVFTTEDTSHYHIPLLLNPFGYSTYRGS